MTTSFEDLFCHLESAIEQLKLLIEEEHAEHENEDLAWEQLSQIEDLFVQLFT